MKKLTPIILALLSTSVIFAACSTKKEKSADLKKTVEQESLETVKIDPQIQKLNKVLVSMSPRFKEEFANGDPQEFLSDLQKVLDAEKNFPQDDISLYYLTLFVDMF